MDGEKKTDKNQKLRIIISAALSLIAAIYIIYHIVSGFSADTELYAVSPGVFDDAEVFSGYIFRDDIPLPAGSAGTVDLKYSDGEKVPAESVVADIYISSDSTAGARLAEIKREIDILEKSAVISAESLESLDTEINQLRLLISQKTEDGELAWVRAHSGELTILLNKRALVSEGKTDYSAQIAVLKAERASLLLSLGAKSSSVMTSQSGYFYSYCDGYEGKLTLAVARTVTSENFDEITSIAPAVYSNTVGSLVTDFRWYFICRTDIESSEGFVADTYYDCTFIGNSCSDVLSLQLESKSIDHASGTAVMCFSSSYIPPSFEITRMQRMRAVRGTRTGLCVPVSAVRVIDGQTCVYIFKKGIARVRGINILWERDGIYIVDGDTPDTFTPIAMNDLVVINEKNLYDGKIVG